jgi:FkbM family methyltransferase
MMHNRLNTLVRWVNKKYKNLKYRLRPHLYAPDFWIGLATKNQAGQVVQIGSNDGKADDPLHKHIKKNKQWEVHFVEPVADVFEQLQINYGGNSRFHFHQIAINDGSTQTFYSVAANAAEELSQLPGHHNKLGSFIKNNIVKHLGDRILPYILETEIKGRSLDQFFKENEISNLLVLHIDTEGYDWEILKQFQVKKYAPPVVLFEHKHLSIADKNRAIQLFNEDYHAYRFGQDVLFLKKDVLKSFNLKQQQTISRMQIDTF